MRQPMYTVPPPEKEKKTPALSGQQCQKCGATFRWERIKAEDPKSPLTLRVLEPSAKCDCGYGRGRRR